MYRAAPNKRLTVARFGAWHPLQLRKRTWLAATLVATFLTTAQFRAGAGTPDGIPFGWPMVSHYHGLPYSGPAHIYFEPGKRFEWPTIRPKRWLVLPGIAFNLLFNAAIVASVGVVCEIHLSSKRPWTQFSLARMLWAMTFVGLFLATANRDYQSPLWAWFEYPLFNIYSRAWWTPYSRLTIMVGNGCLFYVFVRFTWRLWHSAMQNAIPTIARTTNVTEA